MEKPAICWNDEGEAQNRAEILPPCGYPNLSNILDLIGMGVAKGRIQKTGGPAWSELYTITNNLRRQVIYDYVTDSNMVKSIQFGILDTVLLAWPESWSEFLWEEIEDQLWGVVTSTVVPFLAVLDVDDIETYLSKNSRYAFLSDMQKILD